MKNIQIIFTIIISVLIISSCTSDSYSTTEDKSEGDVASLETTGLDLFNDNGCTACHLPDSKSVGPSVKEISVAYNDNSEGLVAFLRDEGEAIVDPSQYAVMKVNLSITKEMDQKSLNQLVTYILKN